MGNVAPCLGGGSMVKVMLPDATIEKFDHPVQVAELTAMYPNYAVVHCSTAKPALGCLRTVIIMKMDEFLLPGQAYILYPIPKSSDSVRSSFDGNGAESGAESKNPDVGGERKTKEGSGRQGEKCPTAELTTEELGRNLSLTLMGPAIRKVPSEAVSPVSPASPVSETKGPPVRKVPLGALPPCLEEEKEKADHKLQPCGWTPDLYKICED